jgi:hypothetical protein
MPGLTPPPLRPRPSVPTAAVTGGFPAFRDPKKYKELSDKIKSKLTGLRNYSKDHWQEHFIPGVLIATRVAEEAIDGKGGRDDVTFHDKQDREWKVTPKERYFITVQNFDEHFTLRTPKNTHPSFTFYDVCLR